MVNVLLLSLFKLAVTCNRVTGNTGFFNLNPFAGFCRPDGDPHGIQIFSLDNMFQLVWNLSSILLLIAGALDVLFITVAGLLYVTAADSSRVKQAKDAITYAVLGLVIILSSKAVVTFIASKY